MNHERSISRQRRRRRQRVRKPLRGSPQRPRLSVFRSHKHIYAQVIDDSVGKTLVSASSADTQLHGSIAYGGNKAAAGQVGEALAQRAVAAGIKQVAFDRGQYKYHGRVAALADGARKAGLEL